MPIEHRYSIFCENVIRDAEERISHIAVFENIRAPQFPTGLMFWIDVNLTGAAGEEFNISLVAPDGSVLLENTDTVDPAPALEDPIQQVSTHSIIRVGIRLTQPGV